MKKLKLIGLDFETFSSVDLKKYGLENYVASPDFCPTVASIAEKGKKTIRYDFIGPMGDSYHDFCEAILKYLADGYTIVAHNAGFERRVLHWLGIDATNRVVDSAVMARLLGCGSKLEVASRQLTGISKLEAGLRLIHKFAIPHEGYEKPSVAYCQQEAEDWELFGYYCDVDAEAGLEIVLVGLEILRSLGCEYVWHRECEYELLTAAQNQAGWYVDMKTANWMFNRSWANSEIAKAQFITSVGADLNFKSPQQLKKFCEERGVKVKSLDKYHAPVLLEQTVEALAIEDDEEKRKQLQEVVTMLEIKLEIGGSMLSKLPKIIHYTSADGRLHNQYMHVGAGQTYRTTGTAVQMQNLARLKVDNDGVPVKDILTIDDYSEEWTNDDMAGQLRQVFLAEHEDGFIFVGDFSAVESRTLAYLAGEEWKLDVYRAGRDLYKELVVKYDGIPYEEVTKELRPKGKYSELSCGFQASAKAVQEFMFRLGFVITLEEAAEWVTSWREACPNIVQFWRDLDSLLKYVVTGRLERRFTAGNGMVMQITPFVLPSMAEKHPGSVSLCFQEFHPGSKEAIVTRFIHGVYRVDQGNGRWGLAYYKATESLGEKGLWYNINETATQKANKGKKPGEKRVEVLNTIFGGKLAGIATQSLAREMFFASLKQLAARLGPASNVEIVGQFHDEINVEWYPSDDDLAIEAETLQQIMDECMSTTALANFPLVADIKSARRYIK